MPQVVAPLIVGYLGLQLKGLPSSPGNLLIDVDSLTTNTTLQVVLSSGVNVSLIMLGGLTVLTNTPGSNVISGYNSGDQTITLTGAVTGTGTGSFATTYAGTVPVNKGGTNQTSYVNGELLIGNTTGNTLTKATLTGTSNQVVVTNGGGSITLSLPQSIHTGANPTFASLALLQTATASVVLRLQSTAANDDPTEDTVQNKVTTTDNTQTTLHTFTVPASTTIVIDAYVLCRRTGGLTGTAEDGGAWIVRGVYKNVAGTATVIGAGPTITSLGKSQIGFDATFTLTGATVLCRITGATTNLITWHMTARVRYAST